MFIAGETVGVLSRDWQKNKSVCIKPATFKDRATSLVLTLNDERVTRSLPATLITNFLSA